MTENIKNFSLDWFSLKGKVAIVTGANQNLGMGYAVAFAKAGADLFIPHYTDDVTQVKNLIEAEGRKVAFLKGDLLKKKKHKSRCRGMYAGLWENRHSHEQCRNKPF
jgi:2-deoxy-D-gluconate 3-dehydrogenase